MASKKQIVILTGMIVLLVCGPGRGAWQNQATYYWNGGGDGVSWQDWNNWEPNVPSTYLDFFAIGAQGSSPYSITIGSGTEVQACAVRTYEVETTVTIEAGAKLRLFSPGAAAGSEWYDSAEYSVGYGGGGDHMLNVEGILEVFGVPSGDVFGALNIAVNGNGWVNIRGQGEVLLDCSDEQFYGRGGPPHLRFDTRKYGNDGELDVSEQGKLIIRGDLTDAESYLVELIELGFIKGNGVGLDVGLNHRGGYTYLEAAGQISFEQAESGEMEPVGAAGVNVYLVRKFPGKAADTYTVDYAVTGGTAEAGADYELAAGTLTFSPGETVKTISLSMVNDGVNEDDETIVVTLSNATGPLAYVGLAEHTFTIIDPRPDVSFEAAGSAAPQNVKGPAQVAVVLSNDVFVNAVTVDYAVTGGTATEGVDYNLSAGTLTFAPGETVKTIEVDIVEDGDYSDMGETIVISLSNPTNGYPGEITEHTIVIVDPRVEIGFVEAASAESEVEPSVDFEVRLSGPTGEAVTVDYAVTGGSASGGGVDYTLDAGTLVFESGETSKTITALITYDGIYDGESDETIELTLSNLSGELVTPVQMGHTHTILSESKELFKVDLALPTGHPGTTTFRWDGGGGTTSWQDWENWNPDQNVEDGFYAIGSENSSALNITVDGDAEVVVTAVRTYQVTSTVTIEAGSSLVLPGAPKGDWNGQAEYSVGYGGGGDHTLNVNGRLMMNGSRTPGDVFGRLSIGVGSSGTVNINAGGEVWLFGTIELMFDPRNLGTAGMLNIDGGLLLMEGDRTGDSTLQGYASGGRVYIGGSNAGVSVVSVEIEGETFTTFARGAVQIGPGVTVPDMQAPEKYPDFIPHPLTAKKGWWHWVAQRWYDMYRHDIVWEDGGSYMPADDGIAGTGVHARLGIVYDGDMGLKVAGMTGALAGEDGANGTPIHDPICNTWVQAIDWAEFKWGTILLAFHNLPPGEYELYSYHNNFDCYRKGSSTVACDSTSVQQPNMPSVTAMSLGDAPGLMSILDPEGEAEGTYDHFPYRNPGAGGVEIGCAGVEMLQGAYDVPIQQVTSDGELVPSLIKFRTDGSPVLVVYENGCCVTDTVRPGRNGGRAILNAFEMKIVKHATAASMPKPCDGGEEVKLTTDLSWKPMADTLSHDVYFGSSSAGVANATTSSPQFKANLPIGEEAFKPGMLRYNTTYYWRVDEVTRGGVVKGDVWSFTTRVCNVVDDFERYDHICVPELHGMFDRVWMGIGGAEGGLMQNLSANWPERCTVNMEMQYYNRSGWSSYSEAGRVFGLGRDWSSGGLDTLSLSFKGDLANDADRLYVVIEDDQGYSVEVEYDGEAGLNSTEWQSFSVDLDEVGGVDLKAVKKFAVGVGEKAGSPSGAIGYLYIDDISVCSSGADAGCACPGDLNDDGQIDLEDLQAVAGILLDAGSPFVVGVEEGHCGDLNTDVQLDLEDLQAVAGILLQAGSPFIVPCE